MNLSLCIFVICAVLAGVFLAATFRAESLLHWPAPRQSGDSSLGGGSVNWLITLAAGTALAICAFLIE